MVRMFNASGRFWVNVGVAALVSAVSVSALAGISEDVIKVTASNKNGSASYVLKLGDTGWDYRNDPNSAYSWSLDHAVDLVDPSTGYSLGRLNDLSIFLRNDPQQNLQFSVQAGSDDTSFTILTGRLDFDSISNGAGTASSAFTLTDTNNNGAKIDGMTGPSSSATYWAAYNGDMPDVQTFTEMLKSLSVAPGESSKSWSGNDPQNGGYRSLDAEVHSMSTAAQFNLSAYDLLSATSNYEIVPEPAGLFLLALATLSLRRASR